MNQLTDLVRAELRAVAEAHPVPADLADRAIAGQRRRVTRRMALVGAAGAAAILAGGSVLLPAGSGGPVVTTTGPNVVYAAWTGERWRILDPDTGRYREVALYTVSAPTADLRYAMVTPAEPTARRIGRYESSTGKIRWYDLPVSMRGEPMISPDGRYAATAGGVPGSLSVLVTDLATGHTTVSTPEAVIEPPLPRIGWQSDSRHLSWENQILDLSGHVTATLPIGDPLHMIAMRPDGTALLINVVPSPAPASIVLGLSDVAGKVTLSADVAPACRIWQSDAPVPTGSPSGTPPCVHTFVGWRGADRILLQDRSQFDRLNLVELDLRTGDAHVVRPPLPGGPYGRLVIAQVTDPADVVAAATF